jgi:hypothetical protein
MSRRVPRGGPGPEWPNEPEDGQAYGDQGAQHNGYGADKYNGNGNGAPGQDQRQRHGQYGQYGGPGRGGPADYGQQQAYGGQPQPYAGQPQPYGGQGGDRYVQQGYGPPGYQPGPNQGQGLGQGYDNQPTQTFNYQGAGTAYQGNGDPRGYTGYNGYNGDPGGYQDGRVQGNMRRYEDPQRFDEQRYQVPGQGPGGPALPGQPGQDEPPARKRKVRFRRTRRLFRLRSVRIVSALVGLFLIWVVFSVGQAAFQNNGQGVSANVAEWARDHGLGPIVTFGEWVSYNPPPKGGKPSFSLAVPSGEALSPT